MLNDRSDAYELLGALGAPDRLVRHAQFVGQAADRLLLELEALASPATSASSALGLCFTIREDSFIPKSYPGPGPCMGKPAKHSSWRTGAA